MKSWRFLAVCHSVGVAIGLVILVVRARRETPAIPVYTSRPETAASTPRARLDLYLSEWQEWDAAAAAALPELPGFGQESA